MLSGWWKNFFLFGASSSRVTTWGQKQTVAFGFYQHTSPASQTILFVRPHLKGEPAGTEHLKSLGSFIFDQLSIWVKSLLKEKRKISCLFVKAYY